MRDVIVAAAHVDTPACRAVTRATLLLFERDMLTIEQPLPAFTPL